MSDEPKQIEPQPVPVIEVRRGEERSTLRMIQRAVINGWPITDEMRKAAVNFAAKTMLEAKSEQTRLRAIEALVTMSRDNNEQMFKLHHVERLESGQSTEIIDFAPMEF